jgi:hypothetical protein
MGLITESSRTWADFKYTQVVDSNWGDAVNNFGSSNSYVGDNTVTKGGPVSNYKELISNGQNATTLMQGTIYRVRNTPASLAYGETFRTSSTKQWWYYTISGQFCRPQGSHSLSAATAQLQSADNLAASRFYQNLASVTSSFKGMVAAGELKSSLRMIRHPAQSLRKGISNYLSNLKRSYRGMKFNDRKRFVRDTWLEYSFGWRPLVSDIDAAITDFYNSKHVGPLHQMVRGSGESKDTVFTKVGALHAVGRGYYLVIDSRRDDSAHVKYYGVVHSTGKGVLNNHSYGFAPWEFVPTLWELIPYSFLVDYFTNIGDIVSSWSYRSIALSWSARGELLNSRLYTSRAELQLLFPSGGPPEHTYYQSGDPGSSSIELRAIKRSPGTSVGVPTLELSVPGLSSKKWLNLAALSSQLNSARRSVRP